MPSLALWIPIQGCLGLPKRVFRELVDLLAMLLPINFYPTVPEYIVGLICMSLSPDFLCSGSFGCLWALELPSHLVGDCMIPLSQSPCLS